MHRRYNMTTSRWRVPYSRTDLEFSVSDDIRMTLAESKAVEPVRDPQAAVAEALEHPIGSPRLCEIAHPGDRVCIVFTDITRVSPDDLLVPALLSELQHAGVRDSDVTLLCGIGM